MGHTLAYSDWHRLTHLAGVLQDPGDKDHPAIRGGHSDSSGITGCGVGSRLLFLTLLVPIRPILAPRTEIGDLSISLFFDTWLVLIGAYNDERLVGLAQ
jgi:hypothetical protein